MTVASVQNSLSGKWFVRVLYVVLLTLPFLIPSWHSKLLILLGVLWLIFSKGRGIKDVKNNLLLIITILIVAIDLIGLLYSENTRYGFSYLESVAPLALVPLIILSAEKVIDVKVARTGLICFVVGVMALNLASLFFISYDLWDPHALQANLIVANNSIVQIHPAFLSLYISLCIFFLADRYFPLQRSDRSKFGWVLFSMIVLVIYLIWLNSRAGIISFSIAALVFIFYRYHGKARWTWFSGLVIILVFVLCLPFSRERFIESPAEMFNEGVATNISTNPNIAPMVNRFKIYECSWEIITNGNFFYGYGTGDGKDELQKCFTEKNYQALTSQNLDSHNEYIAEMHRHGIIGLIVFISLLGFIVYYAFKQRSALLLAFVVVFAITALFENVLSAQKGITFFALLAPLLMLYAKETNHSKQPNSVV